MTNDHDKRSDFERDQLAPEGDEKRPTVTVTCAVPNGITMRMHSIGEGKPWQLGHTEVLKPGPNPGLDKEFVEAWLEENKNLSVVVSKMIVAADEPDQEEEPATESAERAKEEH